jgi:hypothetical protein
MALPKPRPLPPVRDENLELYPGRQAGTHSGPDSNLRPSFRLIHDQSALHCAVLRFHLCGPVALHVTTPRIRVVPPRRLIDSLRKEALPTHCGAVLRELAHREEPLLGYGGHEDWRDMSEYLVHLTDRVSFDRILQEEVLVPGDKPFGAAANLLPESHRAVCLSEIPLDRLDRLVERHGEYGVGFRKSYVREAPVWYVPRGTFIADSFRELVRTSMEGGIDPDDMIWRLTPFVDNPGRGETWRLSSSGGASGGLSVSSSSTSIPIWSFSSLPAGPID